VLMAESGGADRGSVMPLPYRVGGKIRIDRPS